MKNELDVLKYKEYFHYGLNFEKNDILDAILLDTSEEFNAAKIDKEKVYVLEKEIEQSEELYLQFERFIKLTTPHEQKWYRKLTKKDVAPDIEERMQELQKSNQIVVVTYQSSSGIYITDRWSFKPDEYLGIHRWADIEGWIKEDILPILKYLRELEKDNPYQYCSLFMDTQYARNLNANQETKRIKELYTLFMEMVKPAKSDVSRLFNRIESEEEKNFIQQNCADYWTITDLKKQAESDKYRQKLYRCCSSFRDKDLREN